MTTGHKVAILSMVVLIVRFREMHFSLTGIFHFLSEIKLFYLLWFHCHFWENILHTKGGQETIV